MATNPSGAIYLRQAGLSEMSRVDIGPVRLPQTPTAAILYDVRIYELQLWNDGASDATVTISDRQNSPLPIIPTVDLPKGGMVSLTCASGRPVTGGVTWSASQPGVYGWIHIGQDPKL